MPSAEEVEFVLEILDKIASPALDKIEGLLDSAGRWDSIARNDFCRCAMFQLFLLEQRDTETHASALQASCTLLSFGVRLEP